MPKLTDKSFIYHDATATAQPGYLKKKFDRLRREQEAVKKAQAVAEAAALAKAAAQDAADEAERTAKLAVRTIKGRGK